MKLEAIKPGQLITSYNYSGEVLITGSRAEKINSGIYDLQNHFVSKDLNIEAILENPSIFLNKAGKGSIIKNIAKYMVSHDHGGALLLVPDNDTWKKSISNNPTYELSCYNALKEAEERRTEVRERQPDKSFFLALNSSEYRWANEQVWKTEKLIGQLTAVDGATIISDDLIVFAFGAKIKAIDSENTPNEIEIIEPFEGSISSRATLASIGGTRHQSAAQFVYDQKGAIALVASQDGRLSVFEWDDKSQIVRMILHAEYTT